MAKWSIELGGCVVHVWGEEDTTEVHVEFPPEEEDEYVLSPEAAELYEQAVADRFGGVPSFESPNGGEVQPEPSALDKLAVAAAALAETATHVWDEDYLGISSDRYADWSDEAPDEESAAAWKRESEAASRADYALKSGARRVLEILEEVNL